MDVEGGGHDAMRIVLSISLQAYRRRKGSTYLSGRNALLYVSYPVPRSNSDEKVVELGVLVHAIIERR
jgi:hypothetical protein